MPEGPEVALLAEELHFFLLNRKLTRIVLQSGRYMRNGWDPTMEQLLNSLPCIITKVTYKGKLIIIELLDKNRQKIWLFNTLGMSGHWSFEEYRHSHIRFELEHIKENILYPDTVFFTDQRCFGTFNAAYNEKDADKRMRDIKPGFLGEYKISLKEFTQNFKKAGNIPLAKALIDQKRICSGVGNYLLSEIIYRSELDPFLPCRIVKDKDIPKLYEITRDLIVQSYELGGATIENYGTLSGETGEATSYFKAYGRLTDDDGYDIIQVTGPHGRTLWLSNRFKYDY